MARVLTFILGIALGAAAGIAVGITVGGGPAPESDDVGGATTGPVAPGSDTPGGTPRDRRDGQRPRRAAGDILSSIDVGDLGPITRGSGAITGHVFDESGRGIPGVRVTARPGDDAPPEGLAPTDDDEEQLRRDVREVVRRFRWAQAFSRRSVTDAGGAFRCEGLSDRAFSLDVELAGWEFDRAGGGSLWDLHPGADVDVVGSVRHDARIEVLLPGGQPAPSADIEYWRRESPDNTRSTSWEPTDPSIRLQPGEWRVRATSGADEEFESDEAAATVTTGSAAPTIRLQLRERPGVLVEIGPAAAADGPTVVRVSLRRAGDRAAPGDDADDDGVVTRHGSEPGGRGFLAVAPGAYELVAANAAGREFHREVVTVGSGLVRRTIAIPAGDLRDWFLVRALGPDGAAAPDCEFQAVARRGGNETSSGLSWTRVRDGHARVELPAPEDLGDDDAPSDPARGPQLTLRASSHTYGTVEVPWEPVAGREYTVQFAAPAQLEVTAPEAPPGTELIVRVRETSALGDPSSWTHDVRNGTATFAPLPVGEVTVDLMVRDRNYRQNRVSGTTISLHAGMNQVALTMPRLHTLRVRGGASGEPDGIDLYALSPDGSRDWWSDGATKDGAKSWDLLPAGTYLLRDDTYGEMTVQIPGPADVTFAPKPWNAVRFEVDHDSDIARAGLRDGDIGIALDGTEFETPRQISALFAAASLKSRSRITVLRGGQRIDVEFDFGKLGDDLSWNNAVR